jgi:hypothetical protein
MLGKNVTEQVLFRKSGKDSLDQGNVVNVLSRKKGHVGPKAASIDLEPLRNIPLNERMTLEAVSKHLGIGKARLIRYMRQGHLRRHSNSIKPYLTEANKKTRLQWCVDLLDPNSLPNDPRFKDLFDHVFIDENWFFLTKNLQNITCYPMKMIYIVQAKVRITFHA